MTGAGSGCMSRCTKRLQRSSHSTQASTSLPEIHPGWINLGVANDDLWRRFCKAAEMAELADDPRFASAPDRVRNRDALIPLVKAILKQRTRDAWLKRLDDGG